MGYQNITKSIKNYFCYKNPSVYDKIFDHRWTKLRFVLLSKSSLKYVFSDSGKFLYTGKPGYTDCPQVSNFNTSSLSKNFQILDLHLRHG